jgi:Flp pilus assembly protein TadG
VIQRFKNLLKRFHRDESGAFLVLFGILAIVLVATSGAVVDFSSIEQARTRAQVALDAAALGLQPHVFDTNPVRDDAYFIDKAQLLLEERLGLDTGAQRITVEVTDATINVRDGTLQLDATVEVPTYFVALVGIQSVRARLTAQATRRRLNLEVVMVLDNSGSMLQSSRMVKLKEAAISATNILFDNAATQPNVFVGVVPFAQFVNVGTGNRTAAWMSQTGETPLMADDITPFGAMHFDDDDDETTAYTKQVNRWDLYDGLTSGSWAGCVDARFTPYDTDDDPADPAAPASMFFPVFAMDGAPSASNAVYNYISNDSPPSCNIAALCERTDVWTKCNSAGGKDGSHNCSAGTSTYKRTMPGGGTFESTSSNTCNCAAPPYLSENTSIVKSSGSNYTKTYVRTCNYSYKPTGLSSRELQERLCKYVGASFTGTGPNTAHCPVSMLPLTNQSADVIAKINAMNPPSSATTNIAQGAIWGYHMISPGEPLAARSYQDATSKVLIIMTDGENNSDYATYGNRPRFGNDSYSAWGYRYDKRLLTESTTVKDSVATEAQFTAEIDRRTKLACANARAPVLGETEQKIKVYTIGLAAPLGLQQMLRDCASPNETIDGQTVTYAYFPSTAADLEAVFVAIASQLSELRLAR